MDSLLPGRLVAGADVDGFRIGECIHAGGNGYLYRVSAPAGRDPGFPLVMKVPAIGRGQPSIAIVGFEIEQMILPALTGPYVPRAVATGDVVRVPYIVMEWIDGEGLAEIVKRAPLDAAEVARIGATLADALHDIHTQDVVHLDLKPENVLLRPDGRAVLLDFGFSRHAGYPDLLAEEQRFAAGSSAYVSPEQLHGVRSDVRSDIFALGVLLYELATGELPFGEPSTIAGMRDRVWREPVPPRGVKSDIPPWLQEVILHCLEPEATRRYQSAALVAFDLRHADEIGLSDRAQRTATAGFVRQVGRWWRHARERTAPLATRADARTAPVIMVAVDTENPDDERHPALQQATRKLISLEPDFRLLCVSAIRAAPLGEGDTLDETASGKHLEHIARLRQWVTPLGVAAARTSLHAVESANAVDTLLELARANHVDLIILGAPDPAQARFAWWRSVASGVTANAPCSVHVVRVPERRPE